ncbi:HET-domain-containing protein, partial [Stipitochalara longipes BDJ]
PSRLINVGYPGDEMVYLRDTKGEKGAYITLSYVWGGPARIPKTTTSNINEQKNGILVSSLPQTFQDVITITRKLNVAYVWIDALCIVQDDEEGWNGEVSQMARIYQFSLLTVAATGAEDASRGCFLDRAPTPIEIGPIISLPYRTREGVVSGRFMVVEQHMKFAEEYDRFVEKSPLLKRGWIFQERVLSRRMVHYTRGKMYLECRTHRYRDECQEGVGKDETQLGFWGPEIKGKMFPKKDPNPFEATLLGRWYMAIKIYSQLRLTKTSDKLAAVAGVAREFQVDGSALHTPLYVSGLWSHDLLYGLSWYLSKPPKLCIAGNKAPSWSWASWHTPIEW